MSVIAETCVDPLQGSAALNKYVVRTVHQNLGDSCVAQQRLEWPKAEDLIQQVGLDLLLFAKT